VGGPFHLKKGAGSALLHCCVTGAHIIEYVKQNMWIFFVYGGKTGVTADRDKIEFRLFFSLRNLTQVTSTMKPGQGSMFGFASVKRITLREGLY